MTKRSGIVPSSFPPPHERYLVQREAKFYTCTVCYGMHAPWWIVHTMQEEADPAEMQNGDIWELLP